MRSCWAPRLEVGTDRVTICLRRRGETQKRRKVGKTGLREEEEQAGGLLQTP